jgi:hypothetical protein
MKDSIGMTQNQKPSKLALNQEDEISILNILIFLKRSYKFIGLAGLLGIAASFGYLIIVPKQYQATAQIQMAQIGVSNNNNINPLGINIEEPAILVARLSNPTSYSAEIAKACGLDSTKEAQAILPKLVNLKISKGIANTVDLKIIGASPEASLLCAHAVFDLIKNTQAQIIKPYIEEAKVKLLYNQERLGKAQELVMKADRSESGIGAAYLSTRDEIRFLLDENTALKNMIISNENRATRLLAPIYVGDDPTGPIRRNVLLAGLLGGLFLGLLIAYGRQLLLVLKVRLEDNALPK